MNKLNTYRRIWEGSIKIVDSEHCIRNDEANAAYSTAKLSPRPGFLL